MIKFLNKKPGFGTPISKTGKTIGLFGKQGAGKTSIMVSANLSKVFYLSFEGNSALSRSKFSNVSLNERKFFIENQVLDLSTEKDFFDFAEMLKNVTFSGPERENIVKFWSELLKDKEIVVFDSITVFKKLALSYFEQKGFKNAYGALSNEVYQLVGTLQTFIKEILTQTLGKHVFLIGMIEEKMSKKSVINDRGQAETKEDVSLELEWKNAGDAGKKTFLAGIDYMFLIERRKSGNVYCFSYDERASDIMRQNHVQREIVNPTPEAILEAIFKAEGMPASQPQTKVEADKSVKAENKQ
jgi:hypothetical protein